MPAAGCKTRARIEHLRHLAVPTGAPFIKWPDMPPAHADRPLHLPMPDCHINDAGFANAALGVLDGWIADGTVAVSA